MADPSHPVEDEPISAPSPQAVSQPSMACNPPNPTIPSVPPIPPAPPLRPVPPNDLRQHFVPAVTVNPTSLVPNNTLRSNRTAVHAIVRHLRKSGRFDYTADPNDVDAFIAFLFSDCCRDPIPQERLAFVHDVLREFILNYRSDGDKAVTPSTMRGYIASVQRVCADYGYKLSLLSGSMFSDGQDTIRSLLDKLSAARQANADNERPLDVFPRRDIIKLIKCDACSPKTPLGYLNRLVLIVGISLGVRPSAMVNLTMDQFKIVTKGGERTLLFTEKVDSENPAPLTKAGDLNAVRRRLTQVEIRNRPVLDGLINVYDVITEYLEIRRTFGGFSERFFIQVNHTGDQPARFFKRQHLGRNAFSKIISTMCARAGVSKTGVMEMMAWSGVRGTLAPYLLGAGHTDKNSAIRSTLPAIELHKDHQDLNGVEEGLTQPSDQLGTGENNNLELQEGDMDKRNSEGRDAKRLRTDHGSSSPPPSNDADIHAIPNVRIPNSDTMPAPGIGIVVVSSRTVKLTVPERYEIIVDCDMDGMNIRINNNCR